MEKVNAAPDDPNENLAPKREPLLNLPGSIVLLAGIMIAIHLVRHFLLSPEQELQFLYFLAFFPASYGETAASAPYPLSGFWSPLTHGFLHADFLHLSMNLIWMAAFGSPVAQRFGAVRFYFLTIICVLAGALLHYLTAEDPFIPVIGASGAVSGYMGAAARFAFQNFGRGRGFSAHGKALGLFESFKNRQFLMFFLIWMGMNYFLGSGIVDITGEGSMIAWQAHVGGFLAGILFFGLLDPYKNEHAA